MKATHSHLQHWPGVSASPASVRLDGGDVVISRIGFGCAGLMRLPSARQRRNVIAAAIDAGLTHFDVARMYGLGAAEGELRRALQGRRDRVTIATKFGIEASGALRWLGRLQAPVRALLASSAASRTAVRRRRDSFVSPRVYDVNKARHSLEESLRKLGVDHVDILFLHDPRPQDRIDAGLAAFLEEARTEGKVRAWGMSLDDPSGTEVLSRLPEEGIVQLRHDVLSEGAPRPRSIAFGALSAHGPISQWLSEEPDARRRWAQAIGADPLERDLLAELLLGHTLDQAGVVASLYSTTQPSRMALPASIMRTDLPGDRLAAFADCLAADRDAIARLAAR
ncbi:MAG TPA: aldo/keto reductase [Solirubrobacteraceae bacterium]|nr:aldo/keto reductase [Solirubrobacteraceae bacterium]